MAALLTGCNSSAGKPCQGASLGACLRTSWEAGGSHTRCPRGSTGCASGGAAAGRTVQQTGAAWPGRGRSRAGRDGGRVRGTAAGPGEKTKAGAAAAAARRSGNAQRQPQPRAPPQALPRLGGATAGSFRRAPAPNRRPLDAARAGAARQACSLSGSMYQSVTWMKPCGARRMFGVCSVCWVWCVRCMRGVFGTCVVCAGGGGGAWCEATWAVAAHQRGAPVQVQEST